MVYRSLKYREVVGQILNGERQPRIPIIVFVLGAGSACKEEGPRKSAKDLAVEFLAAEPCAAIARRQEVEKTGRQVAGIVGGEVRERYEYTRDPAWGDPVRALAGRFSSMRAMACSAVSSPARTR